MRDVADRQRLQVVAHRAGNDPDALRAAVAAGADLVEADVYAFRGRIEVRHARTLGPWWSRRFEIEGVRPRLIPATEPRLLLRGIVEAAGPDVPLMLDLKGTGRGGGPSPVPDPATQPASTGTAPGRRPPRAATAIGARWAVAVGRQVAAEWDAVGAGAPLVVSAQTWAALGAFLVRPQRPGGLARPREGVTVVFSAGTVRQAAVVAARAAAVAGAGIGLAAGLLDPVRARAMREVTDTLFCWGLSTREQVQQAHGWGVTHVIVDDVSLARGLA